MPELLQRTRNTNDGALTPDPITLNELTAVKIADANPNRMFFEISILPKSSDVCVFIRLYATAQDTNRVGIWIGRFNFGNDTFFRPFWAMPSDNIYTGEISAILLSGDPDEDVYVTEY